MGFRQLFNVVDADNSGYLDKSEVATALNLLGFRWLKEKHVEKIFERLTPRRFGNQYGGIRGGGA